MPDAAAWIHVIRTSHDRFAGLVTPLSADALRAPSYDSEWTIADVASHLGSQAEIFDLFLTAAHDGTPAPGGEAFGPIWDRWNAMPPEQQASESVARNEALVTALEQMPSAERDAFALSMFGMELDLAGFAAMRLGEHALHTWDIAVALDPDASVAADAVDLVVDELPKLAGRAGKPREEGGTIAVVTSGPEREFQFTLGPEVRMAAGGAGDDALSLPAEALVRLVYGRLDAEHTPADLDDERIDRLRALFPGF
jgi:uncharacterized protein (TIGR03083 family)